MPLIIVEGARRSGKSYLINEQDILPVFKFDFNLSFSLWDLGKGSKDTHWFGLGKEVMLHELDNSGFLRKTIIDRGILTNSVWGVFQGRVTEEQAKQDLINFYKRGLLANTKIILVEGEWSEKREKDIWDEDDARGEYERSLFTSFSLVLEELGVEVIHFTNNFDSESLERFKNKISML
jgi:hypothetical protein